MEVHSEFILTILQQVWWICITLVAVCLLFFFFSLLDSTVNPASATLSQVELRSVTCWSVQRWTHQMLTDDIQSRDGCTTPGTAHVCPPAGPSRLKGPQKSAQNRPASSFIDCFFFHFHFLFLRLTFWGKTLLASQRGADRSLSGRVDTVGLFAFYVFTRARRCGMRRNNSDLVGRILQPQHEMGLTGREHPVWTKSAKRRDYWRPFPHVPGYLNKLLQCNLAFYLLTNRF